MEEKNKKILVAEDDKPMAKALNLKLTNAGFEVVSAFSGEEALAFLEKEKFDLIITDLVMPKGDGFFILSEVKNRSLNIPVIVTSNLSQQEDEIKAKEMGAKEYFIKSNTPIIDIVNYVKKFLN